MNIFICENCKKEFEKGYGKKNRFCTRSCCASFNAKKGDIEKKRKAIEKARAIQKEAAWIEKESKEGNCRFCNKLCKNQNSLRNHERLCKENPHRSLSGFSIYNSSFYKRSNQYIKAKELGLAKPICSEETREKLRKAATGRKHTKEYKKRMSEIAKKNGFGGWHTSKSFNYKGVILDSTYEVALAKDLDKNNIKWERPKPFVYKLNGEEHRYYPDFFLPDYNVFVDTKNDYLINRVNPKLGITDIEKIHLVEQQNHIKVFILDKNNLLWSSLKFALVA